MDSEQGKHFVLCPSSRLRIWSRETGSAVPSRVSLLILHTQAEPCAYSRDSSRFPRRRSLVHLNRHTPSGQSRVYRVTQLRTDGIHYCQESAGTGPSTVTSSNGETIGRTRYTCHYTVDAEFLVQTDHCIENEIDFCSEGGFLPPVFYTCMVQCNGGFLPDIILLTLCNCRWGTECLPLQPMFPPQRFDTVPLCLIGWMLGIQGYFLLLLFVTASSAPGVRLIEAAPMFSLHILHLNTTTPSHPFLRRVRLHLAGRTTTSPSHRCREVPARHPGPRSRDHDERDRPC